MRIVVGTRGSALALKQTELVMQALSKIDSSIEFVTQTIRTFGDRSEKASQMGDGWFVKEIQTELLDGTIDLAVHSLKDLPTDEIEGLRIAAIPRRADARDALVGATLDSLRQGAVVGTGSPRRQAQLLARRPDLEVAPIRGNVPTRIERVRSGAIDAAVLAAAGLERLGLLGAADELLPIEEFVPAPGQGAIAVEVRADDSSLIELCEQIQDPSTRKAVQIERAVLRGIGGGCLLPFGAHAIVREHIRLIARLHADGEDKRVDVEGDDAFALVKEVIGRLR
ncbi:MAG: hydroxymethylbilane synthase [Actinomycetota bacterium]